MTGNIKADLSVDNVHTPLAGQPQRETRTQPSKRHVEPEKTPKKFPQVMPSRQPEPMNRKAASRPPQQLVKESRNPHPSKRRAHQPGPRSRHPYIFIGHRGARHRPRPLSEGPDQGQCTHVKAKTPLTRGSTVPEVGLEPHSSPYKHWELPKTYRIRPSPADVRPSPRLNLLTMSTPPNSPLLAFQPPTAPHMKAVRFRRCADNQSEAPPGPVPSAGGTHAGNSSCVQNLAGIQSLHGDAPPFDNVMVRSAETHMTRPKRPLLLVPRSTRRKSS